MVTMCEVRSREKISRTNQKRKNTMVNSEKKWIMMNPI
jgi:hypothetical protein